MTCFVFQGRFMTKKRRIRYLSTCEGCDGTIKGTSTTFWRWDLGSGIMDRVEALTSETNRRSPCWRGRTTSALRF